MGSETAQAEKKSRLRSDEEKSAREHASFRLTVQYWIFFSTCVALLLGLAFFSGDSRKLRHSERNLSWKVAFDVREQLIQNPPLDSRLFFFLFDDAAVQSVQKSGLSIREWASLLNYIEKHRPASVYIDKVFAPLDDDTASIEAALQSLQALKTPLSTAAFTSERKIVGRDELSLNKPQFKLKNFFTDASNRPSNEDISTLIENLNLPDRTRESVYGSIRPLQDVFRHGLKDDFEDNQVFPLYRVANNQLMPSWMFSGALDLQVNDAGLQVERVSLPRTRDGGVLVNWLNPTEIQRQVMSLSNVLVDMRNGRLLNKIPEGAHIVVVPESFTRSIEFVDSPFGRVPRWHVTAAVLNSALTKHWLSDTTANVQFLMLLVALASACLFLKGLRSWFALGLGMIVIALLGLHQFVFRSHDVPWVMGEFFFLGTGLFLHTGRVGWNFYCRKAMQNFDKDQNQKVIEELKERKQSRDAESLSRVLKPEEVPQWPGFEISAFHQSFSGVSGDWYFFEKSSSGRYAHFVLCDLSGQGVQAALVISACKTLLSTLRLSKDSIFESHEFVQTYARQLNKILFLHGEGSNSASFLGLTFDYQTGKVLCLDCGNPFPVLHARRGNKLETLTTFASDPIGYHADVQLKVKERHFTIGDCVIAYSNGLPVARGRRTLRKYFREIDQAPLISAQRLYDALIKSFATEEKNAIEDDVSLVVFRKVA